MEKIFIKETGCSIFITYNFYNYKDGEIKLEFNEKLNSQSINTSIYSEHFIKIDSLCFDDYSKLLDKYDLNNMKAYDCDDAVNRLCFTILKNLELYDLLIIGTVGLSFESIELLINGFLGIPEKLNKTLVFIVDTYYEGVLVEKVTDKTKHKISDMFELQSKNKFESFKFKM